MSRAAARRRRSIACAAVLAVFAVVPSACTALLSADEPIEVAASHDAGANVTPDGGDAAATPVGDATPPTPDAAAPFDGAGVVLSIAPNQVTFGGGAVSGPASAAPVLQSVALTVHNEGVAPSPPLDVALVGNADFRIDSTTCAAPLAPGESCTVDVSSALAPGGPWAGLVQVGSEGVFGYAELFDLGSPALALDASCHDFGGVPAGTVSSEFVYTLTNVSGAVVTGISVTFPLPPGRFLAGPTQTCGSALDPGASCSIGVVFAPESACAYGAVGISYGAGALSLSLPLYGEDGPPDDTTPCYGACGVYGSVSACDGGPGTPCYDGGDGAVSGSSSASPESGPPPLCVPQTCADLGFDCGKNGDACGNVLDCGPCVSPQVCGGGGYGKCG